MGGKSGNEPFLTHHIEIIGQTWDLSKIFVYELLGRLVEYKRKRCSRFLTSFNSRFGFETSLWGVVNVQAGSVDDDYLFAQLLLGVLYSGKTELVTAERTHNGINATVKICFENG
jgi:hypothetical protein